MRSTRVRVGLYGLVFHAVVVAVALATAAANRQELDGRFWVVGGAAVLLAAFAVYALLVAPYVLRRDARKRGIAFLDAAIGMAAEPAIAILATLLFSLAYAAPAAASGASAFAAALGGHVYLGLLWLVANFATQILVIGNAAGFVGFVLLKRLAARTDGAARSS